MISVRDRGGSAESRRVTETYVTTKQNKANAFLTAMNKSAFDILCTNSLVNDILQLRKQRDALFVGSRHFDAGDCKIKCARGRRAHCILISQAEIGDRDVNVIYNSFENFH